jgi:tRNA1(Val) A37 N6-methylase TrmN6
MKSQPIEKPFRFKQFEIYQDKCIMKVGTDGTLLGAWSGHKASNHILDIGTGTGLIALMLAQRFPSAKIDALELDDECLQASPREYFWIKIQKSCVSNSRGF